MGHLTLLLLFLLSSAPSVTAADEIPSFVPPNRLLEVVSQTNFKLNWLRNVENRQKDGLTEERVADEIYENEMFLGDIFHALGHMAEDLGDSVSAERWFVKMLWQYRKYPMAISENLQMVGLEHAAYHFHVMHQTHLTHGQSAQIDFTERILDRVGEDDQSRRLLVPCRFALLRQARRYRF